MKKYFLLLALFIAALNQRPIITSVAPLLRTMQNDLAMSGLTASLLTTLPVLCMGIFAPAATVLRDRVGLERTIFIALFLITGATALRGIVSSVFILVVSALVGGIGISLAGPLLSGFIKKYFPTKPGIVSVYSASMTVGAAIASAFAIPLYNRSNHSLTLTLSCWAILGVMALIIWSAFLGNRGSEGNKGNKESLVRSSSKLPIRNKKAVLLTLFFGLMASMFYSVTAWISPIALNFGYSAASAAMLLTVFTIIQIPVSLTIPFLVSRSGKRRFYLIFCSVSELIGIVMLLFHLPMLPAVILLGIGAGGLFPLALMLPIVETDTPEEAGAWSAMSQCGGYIIGAMGPLLIGAIYDSSGSFMAALVAMLAVIVVMMGVQLLVTGRKTVDQTSAWMD
ncbi:MFS transporter, CP family, cyanate transporter [Paenibacillus algorifonticola]|uniref:MFS transporter, CP family, cyanate transporter n=1 Tax=Paenibacillus algorifonticola TaxID=684063 RepID=A0A1I1ZQG0_9BACL|nr:MFS transporter [Paenibacillus algorifonticola]SFE33915.1 MFS transporter, CP family, cyanate transporter [Paenibacillus algorifonticola]